MFANLSRTINDRCDFLSLVSNARILELNAKRLFVNRLPNDPLAKIPGPELFLIS